MSRLPTIRPIFKLKEPALVLCIFQHRTRLVYSRECSKDASVVKSITRYLRLVATRSGKIVPNLSSGARIVRNGECIQMATTPSTDLSHVLIMTLDADQAWRELLESLDGVESEQAWALPRLQGRGDLATRGSILEIVQHLATSKMMYASTAFCQNRISWDDCFERVQLAGHDWASTVAYLHEAHAFWMESWAGISDDDLTVARMTNWGAHWPTWRIITTISHHDSYHSGQITLLKAILEPTDMPCSTHADYSLATLEVTF